MVELDEEEIECFKFRGDKLYNKNGGPYEYLLYLTEKYASVSKNQIIGRISPILKPHDKNNVEYLNACSPENEVKNNERFYDLKIFISEKFSIRIIINKDNALWNRFYILNSNYFGFRTNYYNLSAANSVDRSDYVYITDEQTEKIIKNQELIKKDMFMYQLLDKKMDIFYSAVESYVTVASKKTDFTGYFPGKNDYLTIKENKTLTFHYGKKHSHEHNAVQLPLDNFIPVLKQIISGF